MKKFKNLLTVFMAFFLTFGLASCGIFNATNPNNQNNNQDPKYTITFMVDNDVYWTLETAGNEKLTLPTEPTKEDYIFFGWYMDKYVWETEIEENSFSYFALTYDITVHARFEKPKITFFVDNRIYATIETLGNEKLTFPEAPEKENTIFWGWYRDKEIWKEKVDENTYLNAPLTEHIKLYAKFDKPRITFVIDDKTYATIETLGNEKLTFPRTPAKANYIFLGWYLDKDVWQNEVDENTFLNTPLTENITLYARLNLGSTEVVLDGITYNLVNRKYVITNCNTSITSVTIPSEVNGVPVSGIEDWAFAYCSGLTSVEIPNSVTRIGIAAFAYCSGLTSVEIPDSVTSIEDWAFFECAELTSVTIGNSVTNIGAYAFELCSGLTNISIPDSVTHMGEGAFSLCSGLLEFNIPNTLTTIEKKLLMGCENLQNVTIGNGVTSIGELAFEGCFCLFDVYYEGTIADWCKIDFEDSAANPMEYAEYFYIKNESGEFETPTKFIIPEGVTEIKKYAFYKFQYVIEIEIPNGVTSIGGYAFSRCYRLTNITIPNSVTSIGERAFCSCDDLISITIPDSVTSIGECAFYGCSSLKDLYFENPNNWTAGSKMFSSERLSDSKTAATLLTKTYRNYTWTRS